MPQGRPRKQLGPELDAEITARTARGESARTIRAALGGHLSERSIARRQSELRGLTRNGQSAPPSSGLPDAGASPADTEIPDTIPDGTTLQRLEWWLKLVTDNARKAEVNGNLQAVASLAMRAAALSQAITKATPLPKPDPNENPDYVKAAKEGEERFLKLIDGIFAA